MSKTTKSTKTSVKAGANANGIETTKGTGPVAMNMDLPRYPVHPVSEATEVAADTIKPKRKRAPADPNKPKKPPAVTLPTKQRAMLAAILWFLSPENIESRIHQACVDGDEFTKEECDAIDLALPALYRLLPVLKTPVEQRAFFEPLDEKDEFKTRVSMVVREHKKEQTRLRNEEIAEAKKAQRAAERAAKKASGEPAKPRAPRAPRAKKAAAPEPTPVKPVDEPTYDAEPEPAAPADEPDDAEYVSADEHAVSAECNDESDVGEAFEKYSGNADADVESDAAEAAEAVAVKPKKRETKKKEPKEPKEPKTKEPRKRSTKGIVLN